MSIYHSKSNYHPVSEIAGSLPNGSHLLPGNGYYSIQGRVPHLRYDNTVPLSDPKLKYSQSWRISALNSLTQVKAETTLPKYYSYYPQIESARDRYAFVPKYRPREQNPLAFHQGHQYFKSQGSDDREYLFNKITSLPPTDHYSMPEANIHNDIYRDYQKPRLPYDMITLRDTNMFKTPYTREALFKHRNYVSASTIAPRP